MRKITVILVFSLLMPYYAFCETEPRLVEVEEKILSGDLKGAMTLFNSPLYIREDPQHYKHSAEIKKVIRYFEELSRFNNLASAPDNESQAVLSYKNLKWAHEHVPKDIHFSNKLRSKIDSSAQESAEKYKLLAAEVAANKERERQDQLKKREDEEKAFKAQAAQEDAERAEIEAALQKECGDEYDQIRIGMKLTRVQQCVGEFYLRGQVKTKNGVVDHYTRDGAYLYVKDGNVVAWGY